MTARAFVRTTWYSPTVRRLLPYVGISLVFEGLLLIVTQLGGTIIAQLDLLRFILLAFAAVRLGRLVAFDLVMQPYRYPFTLTRPDDTGAGDTVDPEGQP